MRRGVFRPRNVRPDDKRSPMRRLLEDGQLPSERPLVAVTYAAQWPTLTKAMRLGYVDNEQCLTDAGRAFLASNAP